MSTYVIGDVHGCFDELMALFKNIEVQDNDARYVFVGDLLDRGPKNVEMARWAVENIRNEEDAKYRSVCGNHDDGLYDWWRSDPEISHGYQYGTELDFKKAGKINLLKAYVDFTRTLPLYIEKEANGQKFVITHGYLPRNYSQYDPFETNAYIREAFNWDRHPLYYKESLHPGITVVFGHNPVILPE